MLSSDQEWAIAAHLVERHRVDEPWRDIVEKLLREVERYLAFWAAAQQR